MHPDDIEAIDSVERGTLYYGAPRGEDTMEAALFDPDPPEARDPVDPLAVGCPSCGRLPGRRCQSAGWAVHPARHAYARHVAGLADTPTPTLLDEYDHVLEQKRRDRADDIEVHKNRGEGMTAIATCGNCGLSWDDSIVTSLTPAPSARCPFEGFHEHGEGLGLEPADIPADFPVRPL
jgi:hypothetical protein